jgi:tetrahydromethanopterin S-methyltransferase subunit G
MKKDTKAFLYGIGIGMILMVFLQLLSIHLMGVIR